MRHKHSGSQRRSRFRAGRSPDVSRRTQASVPHREPRQGEWSKNTFLNGSFCLNGKTLGVIGAGNIGRQVARKAQAFGAVTNYYDPFRLSPEMESEYHLSYLPLKELLASSDLITLHVPLTEENRHMIGAAEIASMKDHAILINTSRGGLVDDKALAEAVAPESS